MGEDGPSSERSVGKRLWLPSLLSELRLFVGSVRGFASLTPGYSPWPLQGQDSPDLFQAPYTQMKTTQNSSLRSGEMLQKKQICVYRRSSADPIL